MEQFSLEKYLENPSRKVVTRQGKSVRIICTDRRHTDSWPIVALEDYGDGEFVIYANIDGRTDMCSENIHDLFFADEEEELTEFEKAIYQYICTIVTACDGEVYGDKELKPIVKGIAKELLDLARRELQPEFDKEMDKMLAETDKVVYQKGQQDALKSLPKLRRDCFYNITSVVDDILYYDGYYIDIKELIEKLPKE